MLANLSTIPPIYLPNFTVYFFSLFNCGGPNLLISIMPCDKKAEQNFG